MYFMHYLKCIFLIPLDDFIIPPGNREVLKRSAYTYLVNYSKK